MQKITRVKLAVLYGSFPAKKESAVSDIDLLIVGNPDEDELAEELEALEKIIHREINYNIYPRKEFRDKLKAKDSFIENILTRPKIILKGSPDAAG